MDHVVPRSHGGPRTFENIVAACRPCNSRKGNLSCDEAGMFPLKPPLRPKALPVGIVDTHRWTIPEEWLPYLEIETAPSPQRRYGRVYLDIV